MSSKFSQVRNRRSKPPHCKPGFLYPPPYLPYIPYHLYCRILHEFHAWGTKWDFEFHLWQHPDPEPDDFKWKRITRYNSFENLHHIAYIKSTDNYQTFDLILHVAGTFGGNYLDKLWSNQVPIRQFPLKTKLLYGHTLQAGTQNFVTIQVIDTGTAYPPPQPGNYGPY